MLEEPDALDADTIKEDRAMAKAEADCLRPGPTKLSDGPRLDIWAAGLSVVRKNGHIYSAWREIHT